MQLVGAPPETAHLTAMVQAILKPHSKNVLDLTDAAISTGEANQPESSGEHASQAKREAVPSITLPRQSSDVRHFAMGKSRVTSPTLSCPLLLSQVFNTVLSNDLRHGGLTCEASLFFARCRR